VAFVDILGFSDEVKGLAGHPANFRRVVKALLGGPTVANPPGDEDDVSSMLASQEGEEHYGADLQYAFFSDCAYVSARSVAGGTDKVLKVVLGYGRHLHDARVLHARGNRARPGFPP
jgi:hypothetical protein